MFMTFALLALAICAVWCKPLRLGRLALPPWLVLLSGALACGLLQGLLRWPALAALGVFGLAAWFTAREQGSKRKRLAWLLLTTLMALALALHLLPGFHNPLLIAGARFTADAAPFTQYANFDKGAVGLILLVLVCRRAHNCRQWRELLVRTAPVAVLVVTVVLAAAVASGLVRPDFKLPAYTAIFLATNLLFVCVAEEAFFRGLLQERMHRALSGLAFGGLPLATPVAVLASAALFGAAHLGAGLAYAAVATLAGLGYALAYARTRRIEAPILLHFTLNAVHFIGFTYPRLA